MRWKSLVQVLAGEKGKITSNPYLFVMRKDRQKTIFFCKSIQNYTNVYFQKVWQGIPFLEKILQPFSKQKTSKSTKTQFWSIKFLLFSDTNDCKSLIRMLGIFYFIFISVWFLLEFRKSLYIFFRSFTKCSSVSWSVSSSTLIRKMVWNTSDFISFSVEFLSILLNSSIKLYPPFRNYITTKTHQWTRWPPEEYRLL